VVAEEVGGRWCAATSEFQYVAVMRGTLRVPDERESLLQEAREMNRLTAAQRVELFCSIMQAIAEVWAPLPFAERMRRVRIGEALEASPRPWWKGVRASAPR
jgi:hypothetical protein